MDIVKVYKHAEKFKANLNPRSKKNILWKTWNNLVTINQCLYILFDCVISKIYIKKYKVLLFNNYLLIFKNVKKQLFLKSTF